MLRNVALVVFKLPHWVLVFGVLMALAGGWLTAFRLGVVNDTNALIRQDSPVLRYFLDYLKEFETKDPMVIVVKSDDFEQNRLVVETLAERIAKRPEEVRSVYYRNDLDRLKPHFLLFEEKARLEQILAQIESKKELLCSQKGSKGVNINTLLKEALRLFHRVEKAKGKRGTLDDLDAFADRMIRDLEKLAEELEKDDKKAGEDGARNVISEEREEFERLMRINTYLAFDEGRMLLMQLIPGKGDPNSFSPHEETIRNLRRDVAEVREAFPGVAVGLTGEPVLLDDELKQSTSDMMLASLVAFGLISALFFIAYREFTRPALAIFSLVCALFWSLGFAVLVVGHLNIISQAFVLMLLGLGIDFGIQIIGRYEEERANGEDVYGAIESALQYTGLAVLTSGGTTAIAFFTMCLSDFVGLAEMGIIAGSGILFCIAANLLLLPALLVWRDSRGDSPVPAHHQKQADFGRKLDRVLFSSPRLALALTAVVSMVAAVGASKVKFDYNLLNLQNPEIESVKLALDMASSPDESFIFGVVVADDMDDAILKTGKLEALPSVSNVVSVTKILPRQQEEKLEILRRLKEQLDSLHFNPDVSGRIDVRSARENLKTLLEYSSEGMEQAMKFRKAKDKRVHKAMAIFERLIPALERAVKSLDGLDQDEAAKRLNRYQIQLFKGIEQELAFLRSFDMENPVTLDKLPPQILKRYISPNGRVLLEVNPRDNIWNRMENACFVADLRSISPKATGTPVQNYVYIDMLKGSYEQASGWALLAIVLVVFIHFRNFFRVLLTMVPLALGIVWMLGFMALFGIPFNPANIIVLPLVIGIGVAYGVYIMDRHLQEGRVRLFGSSTGKAILLSALTTMCGFGAMMLGSYRGLVSLGEVMTLGIAFCFLASVLVLPQALEIFYPPRK